MTDFSTVDYYTDKEVHKDPNAYFDWLRAQGPVTKLPNRDVYAVTGYEEALQVYLDADHYSAVNGVLGPLQDMPFTPQGDDITDQIEAHRHQMAFAQEIVALDPPAHGPLRALLMPLFTPGKLRAKEEGFRRVSHQLIDEFIESGEVELIKGYGTPFATLIITELLGIPEEDRPLFRECMKDAVAAPIDVSPEELMNNPLVQMGMRIYGYIAERRDAPRDDVLGEMAAARFPDGSEPTVDQVTRVAAFLFGAGQDTTAKLLGNCLRLIAERPDIQQVLRTQRERIPDFIEEVLRYEGAVKSAGRLVRRTTTLGGVELKAGTVLLMTNLGVNHDPARFEAPETFDMDRPRSKEHLAFGRGTHTCAGAPLARLEVRISLEQLLDRLDDIRIDERAHGPEGARIFNYEPSYVLRGLEALHLRFTPKTGRLYPADSVKSLAQAPAPDAPAPTPTPTPTPGPGSGTAAGGGFGGGGGTWILTLQTPMGPQEMTARIAVAGETFSGRIESAMGSEDISGTVQGNALSWTMKVSKPMPIKLEFNATVDGDAMTGQAKLGMFGKAALTGTRAPD